LAGVPKQIPWPVPTNYTAGNFANNYCQKIGQDYSWCWTSAFTFKNYLTPYNGFWGKCLPDPSVKKTSKCRETYKKNYKPKKYHPKDNQYF